MLGGAVHSYGVPLVLIRSVIGPNSDPWIKVDSGVESRGLIVLDSILASSAAVCGGLSTSVLHSTATPVGLALNRSEALVHNSSIDSSAQYDATSYLIYSESSNFASHASQDHAISQEAMYAPLNPFFLLAKWVSAFVFCQVQYYCWVHTQPFKPITISSIKPQRCRRQLHTDFSAMHRWCPAQLLGGRVLCFISACPRCCFVANERWLGPGPSDCWCGCACC